MIVSIIFLALSLIASLFAFVKDNPMYALVSLLFLIVSICTEGNTKEKEIIENATYLQVDTIYIISNADTIITYNIKYTK